MSGQMLLRTKMLAVAISAFLLVGLTPVGAQSVYLADMDDLPLAPGLVEDPNARVSFDKPAGRIIEAAAAGDTTRQAVRAFYTRTLPELGWVARDAARWERNRESLTIQIEPGGPPVVVRFSIAPKG
jgi:hypothetical protein